MFCDVIKYWEIKILRFFKAPILGLKNWFVPQFFIDLLLANTFIIPKILTQFFFKKNLRWGIHGHLVQLETWLKN